MVAIVGMNSCDGIKWHELPESEALSTLFNNIYPSPYGHNTEIHYWLIRWPVSPGPRLHAWPDFFHPTERGPVW